MAHEFGPALRASCAFESHITLAHRVLPHIEDWLAATRTRKVCRHSDTGYAGNVPAATRRDHGSPRLFPTFWETTGTLEQHRVANRPVGQAVERGDHGREALHSLVTQRRLIEVCRAVADWEPPEL